MRRLRLPAPVSGGLLLSYRCSSRCRHCMYACGADWSPDWIGEREAGIFLERLAGSIRPAPRGPQSVGVNGGLHFTGGEPFLNFDLLLKTVAIGRELEIPSMFVETNGFWCRDEATTREKLEQLKDAGLVGILISVNPFIAEHVPFEKTRRLVGIGSKVFGRNAMVYQELFFMLFERLGLEGTMAFETYLDTLGPETLGLAEMIPMGRFVYTLGELARRLPADAFFGESCGEELTRCWHVHVDNYGNYMTGFCGGISMGDAADLDRIGDEGIDLDERPVVDALLGGMEKLFRIGEKHGYRESGEGYMSKCHLCVDIRKHLVRQSDAFGELRPREFYEHL